MPIKPIERATKHKQKAPASPQALSFKSLIIADYRTAEATFKSGGFG